MHFCVVARMSIEGNWESAMKYASNAQIYQFLLHFVDNDKNKQQRTSTDDFILRI